ncbi:glycoside hydrolase superfamily [Hyaloraphidium curvatum]|nr:glycoside hydrolase superfamily [Hyaloraphidium curvatum]
MNPDPETRICPVGGGCSDDFCITFPENQSCDGGATVAITRFAGHRNISGCPTANTCWNKMVPSRNPQCTVSVPNRICGQLGYLLKRARSEPQNQGVRFMLGIGGGMDSNYFGHATMVNMIPSFVSNIVNTVINYGFDGVDIDWEYPTFERGGQPTPNAPSRGEFNQGIDCLYQPCQLGARVNDGRKYVDLMRRLRAAFNRRGRNRYGEPYLVSTAIPAVPYYVDRFNVSAICAVSDFINVMSYDYYGPWSSTAGPNAPLFNTRDAALSVYGSFDMLANRGCPRSKMNLGIPFYGYRYYGVSPGPTGFGLYMPYTRVGWDTSVRYSDVRNAVASEPGWRVFYDNRTATTSQSAVAYNRARREMIAFEDPQTIAWKRAWAARTGVGGLMYWSLGLDDEAGSLLRAAVPTIRRRP